MQTAYEEMLQVMPVKTGGFFAHAWNGWDSVSFAFVANHVGAGIEAKKFTDLHMPRYAGKVDLQNAVGYTYSAESEHLRHPLWGEVLKITVSHYSYGWRVHALYIVINRNLAGQDRIVTWDND